MLEESATQLFHIEVSTVDRLWLQKDLQESWRRLLAKPVNEGHGEALLSAIEHLLWDTKPLGQSLEDVLGLAAPHFPSRRQLRNPFGENMVKERSPNLQRVRHAHSIYFGQNIRRQVRFCVEVLDFA